MDNATLGEACAAIAAACTLANNLLTVYTARRARALTLGNRAAIESVSQQITDHVARAEELAATRETPRK